MTLALDGHAHATASTTTSVGAAITTSGADRVIIALVCNDGAPSTFAAVNVSGVSGGGLTWSLRKRYSNVGGRHTNNHTIEEWWAPASAQLTAQTITATFASTIDNSGIIVFGVSGAFDYTNPFDASASLVATAHDDSGTSSIVTGTFSTLSADTFVFGAWSSPRGDSVGTGLTLIDQFLNSGGTDWCAAGAAYVVESAPQSGATLQFSSNGLQTATNWNYLIDAITGDGPTSHPRSFACQIG